MPRPKAKKKVAKPEEEENSEEPKLSDVMLDPAPVTNKPAWMTDELENEDFLSDEKLDTYVQQAASAKAYRNEAFREMAAAAKKDLDIGSVSEVDAKDSRCVLPDFQLQRLFNNRFFPSSRVFEIMGETGIGKTTMAFSLLCTMAKQGCYGYYMMTEGKLPNASRLQRICSTNPRHWELIDSAGMITTTKITNTKAFEDALLTYLKVTRGVTADPKRKVPVLDMKKPIFVVLDSFTKLLPANEAKGKVEYGDLNSAANAKKMQNIGDGSNFGLSKFSHGFFRTWSAIAEQYNVFLICITHQNDDVDMGASFLPAAAMKLNNDTTVGGKALKQSAAYRWLMVSSTTEKKKTTGEIVAKNTKIKVFKNSDGGEGTIVTMKIPTVFPEDSDDFLEPAFTFADSFAEDCANNGWMDTTVSSKRYTCEMIGVEGVTAGKFYKAFLANKEAVKYLGKLLKIEGYQYG
jgi:RecA/RadA recombinase